MINWIWLVPAFFLGAACGGWIIVLIDNFAFRDIRKAQREIYSRFEKTIKD